MPAFANAGQPQLFKYLYPNEAWRMLVVNNRPFLGMVPKGDSATSSTASTSGIVHAFNYADPQAASQSYDSAVSQQDSLVAGQQFVLQLSQFYSSIRLNSKDIVASRNRMAAYMSSQKLNFDRALDYLAFQIDLACHRAGNGIIGTIASVSGSAITLNTNVSAQQFQNSMKVASYSTFPVDGTAPTATGGVATVTKVQQVISNGLVTVTLTLDNVTGFSAGNYIAKVGNALGISSLNPAGGLLGMGNWVPTTSPSASDNFVSTGLNRSLDEVRLSGVRLPSTGATIREAIQQLAAVIHAFGGRPDTVLLNPVNWQQANIELQGFARYETFKVGDVAFKSMVIASPAGGDLRLMSDPNQDVGVVRVLTMDTWKLCHLGELTQLINEDGLTMRKDNGADAFQMQMRSWPQLVCFEPFANGVITL